jgi:hypothetical protein
VLKLTTQSLLFLKFFPFIEILLPFQEINQTEGLFQNLCAGLAFIMVGSVEQIS